jgi:hypothetical protein
MFILATWKSRISLLNLYTHTTLSKTTTVLLGTDGDGRPLISRVFWKSRKSGMRKSLGLSLLLPIGWHKFTYSLQLTQPCQERRKLGKHLHITFLYNDTSLSRELGVQCMKRNHRHLWIFGNLWKSLVLQESMGGGSRLPSGDPSARLPPITLKKNSFGSYQIPPNPPNY